LTGKITVKFTTTTSTEGGGEVCGKKTAASKARGAI
jgi:hypothetical protein